METRPRNMGCLPEFLPLLAIRVPSIFQVFSRLLREFEDTMRK